MEIYSLQPMVLQYSVHFNKFELRATIPAPYFLFINLLGVGRRQLLPELVDVDAPGGLRQVGQVGLVQLGDEAPVLLILRPPRHPVVPTLRTESEWMV